jgi:hypothetical protein
MSYYQFAQSANSARFNKLSREQQRALRAAGYNNRGTANVEASKKLLDELDQKAWEAAEKAALTPVVTEDEDGIDPVQYLLDAGYELDFDLEIDGDDVKVVELAPQAAPKPFSKVVPFVRKHPAGQYKSRFANLIDRLDATIQRDWYEYYQLQAKYGKHRIVRFRAS